MIINERVTTRPFKTQKALSYLCNNLSEDLLIWNLLIHDQLSTVCSYPPEVNCLCLAHKLLELLEDLVSLVMLRGYLLV